MMKRQCVAPVGQRAVSDEKVDVFCEHLPNLVGKLIDMVNYMLSAHASDEAMGHVFDNYLACEETGVRERTSERIGLTSGTTWFGRESFTAT
jgi:hypothetical protein